MCTWVEVRGQLVGVGSLLLPCTKLRPSGSTARPLDLLSHLRSPVFTRFQNETLLTTDVIFPSGFHITALPTLSVFLQFFLLMRDFSTAIYILHMYTTRPVSVHNPVLLFITTVTWVHLSHPEFLFLYNMKRLLANVFQMPGSGDWYWWGFTFHGTSSVFTAVLFIRMSVVAPIHTSFGMSFRMHLRILGKDCKWATKQQLSLKHTEDPIFIWGS